MKRPHPSQEQGFTLVELLVVIAIIAILARLLLPTFAGAQRRPHDVAALQCGKEIIKAETQYKIENGVYNAWIATLGEDAVEACQGIQIQSYVTGFAPGKDVNGNMAIGASATQYNFWVWSKEGSKAYYTSTDDNLKLSFNNEW